VKFTFIYILYISFIFSQYEIFNNVILKQILLLNYKYKKEEKILEKKKNDRSKRKVESNR